jgi:hypothetical protein
MNFLNSIGSFISKLKPEVKYFFWVVLIFYLLFQILYIWNPVDISTNYPVFCHFFLIFVFFISLIGFIFSMSKGKDMVEFFKTLYIFTVRILTILAFVIVIIYTIKNIPSGGALITFFISSIIIIGIVAGAFSLIKQLAKHYTPINDIYKNLTSLYNFAMNFESLRNFITFFTTIFTTIFTIIRLNVSRIGNVLAGPIGGVQNIVGREKKLMKEDKFKPFWNIFIVEFILITSYFAIPNLFKLIMSHDGIKLLERPIYLNNEHQFPEGDDTPLHTTFVNDDKHNYHYSISAWFNLNPQSAKTNNKNDKYINILNYGNKPKISFNMATNSLRIETEKQDKQDKDKNKLTEIYLSKNIPYQRWNNIVINYDGGYMDFFLNGNLVSSESNISPKMTYDKITIGERDGLDGGIKNVTFFNRILTKGEIKYSYDIYSK